MPGFFPEYGPVGIKRTGNKIISLVKTRLKKTRIPKSVSTQSSQKPRINGIAAVYEVFICDMESSSSKDIDNDVIMKMRSGPVAV